MVKSEQRSPELPKLLQPTASSSSAAVKKKLKGVRMRTWGSWVSEIRAPHQKARIWLGSYSSPEAAARAYDAAVLCIKGPAATASSLNFPVSSSQYRHIPGDATPLMSPKSIQRIAAAAAAGADLPAPPPSPRAQSPPSAASSPSLSYSSPSEDDLSSFPIAEFFMSPKSIQRIAAGADLPAQPPPLRAPSPPSVASSPSLSEDDFSSIPFAEFLNEPINGGIDSWCEFESAKYIELLMVNGMGFDSVPATVDDFLYDESDIRLWDFC